MASPARQIVQRNTSPQVYRVSPCTQEPGLLRILVPTLVIGVLAMLHLMALARLSMLTCESRRLERLLLEQSMRRGELMRQRAALTSSTVLWDYATKHGMVSPRTLQPIKVGSLPPGKIYWELPGDSAPTLTNELQVGQLPNAPPTQGASKGRTL